MTKKQAATAAVMLALKELVITICAARPDGAALRARLSRGTTRVLLDERSGLLVFADVAAAGGVEWLESVRVDPSDPGTFGATATELASRDVTGTVN